MDYVQITFRIKQAESYSVDLLMDALADIGFESFEENLIGMVGYCPTALFDEQQMLQMITELDFSGEITYHIEHIPDQNWNAVWEAESFEPIEIDHRCIICAPKHQIDKFYEYKVLINPEQAFGTGYHETTRMMIKQLLEIEIAGRQVLDMGCGTGVLSIVAAMRGASAITAVDIDTWSYRNTIDNLKINNIEFVEVVLGSIESVIGREFDVILANINRNILLEQLSFYSQMLNKDGILLMSGFFESDYASLHHQAETFGLTLLTAKQENNWMMLQYFKKN